MSDKDYLHLPFPQNGSLTPTHLRLHNIEIPPKRKEVLAQAPISNYLVYIVISWVLVGRSMSAHHETRGREAGRYETHIPHGGD